MKKQISDKSSPVFAMALFVLMLGCILTLVIMGSRLYSELVNSQKNNADMRASLAFVSTRVRAADEQAAIAAISSEYGDVLILAQPISQSGYETRIYLHEGNLVEEYAQTGSEIEPQNAQKITKTDTFTVSLSNGLLVVNTSEGECRLRIHSKEAAK